MAGGEVRLVDLAKSFGDIQAVAGITLEIAPGEFFSLLGPSGCGKTTTLRLIAGFERPDTGQILLDGFDMATVPPHQRHVNTVFQNYALFPHLDVGANIAFGLKYQDIDKAESRRLVGKSLELVRLSGLEKRRPHQLSGGQQQRVALARALILNPSVLLLDEPLGALDAKLRKTLQIELKALQEEVGVTFVYVTHDQEEALTMSDRLAVMSEGRVEQVGTPQTVYEEPASAYVADFLGTSNLMDGSVDYSGALRIGEIVLSTAHSKGLEGTNVKVCIRPERIGVLPAGADGSNRVPGRVNRRVYGGATVQLLLGLPGGIEVQAVAANDGHVAIHEPGSSVMVHLPAEALQILPV